MENPVENRHDLLVKAVDALVTASCHQTKEAWAFARRAAEAYKKACPYDPQAAATYAMAVKGYKTVTK